MAAEKRDMDVVISSDSRKPTTIFVPGVGEVEINFDITPKTTEPTVLSEIVKALKSPLTPKVAEPEVITPIEVVEPFVVAAPVEMIESIAIESEPVIIEPEVILSVEAVEPPVTELLEPEFEEAAQPEIEPIVPIKHARGRKPNVQ